MHIALSGKMCSGKSVVAAYLVQNYGFTEYSFAKRLKELAEELFAVKTKDARGRYMLQQLAEHLRAVDNQVWVRYLVSRLPASGNVVVSDVRYPNEYSTLERLGFHLVRMIQDRPEQERLLALHYSGIPLALLDDYSETALDKYTFAYYIENGTGYSLDYVYQQVDDLMKRVQLQEEW